MRALARWRRIDWWFVAYVALHAVILPRAVADLARMAKATGWALHTLGRRP